jgi:hypothetical protein
MRLLARTLHIKLSILVASKTKVSVLFVGEDVDLLTHLPHQSFGSTQCVNKLLNSLTFTFRIMTIVQPFFEDFHHIKNDVQLQRITHTLLISRKRAGVKA